MEANEIQFFLIFCTIAIIAMVILIAIVTIKHNKQLNISKKQAREYALMKGLEVEDITRNFPYTQHGNQKIHSFECQSYCLKHHFCQNVRWSFRQGETKDDETFEWDTIIESGNILSCQQKILNDIASSEWWSEDYLEIEFFLDKVVAYWAEAGGSDAAELVWRYLYELSRSSS